ncbi:glycosyltransferase involved in cell wall biosynthesis [Murinocardiopsis flavida]|uniref:Glycosyltransferase involved in cell wall biosynthesis n=1 Tax=Murinocardiopsis flavida TaxID=645275 RepID=A0A2P8DIU3_9ACTN|nr:glycosyltransferase involved in cell wall biosynthesis [Murinocardiopsis flavida]
MRVALVGPAHPYKGGGARHTTELAHRLTAVGHPTVIESWLAQYPALLYPGTQTLDSGEGEPFPGTRRHLAWYRPDGWLRAGRRLAADADLVVLTVFSPVQVPAYLGVLAGIRGRTRVVALCHNVLPHERRAVDVSLMRALLRRCDAVLTHTPEQARLARGLVGGRGDVRTAALPPHLPTHPPSHGPPDRPRPSDTDAADGVRRLLFFGLVRPYKGVDVLLRALAAGPPDVHLTVAGEFWGGPAELAALAADLGVADRVELRSGYVPVEDMAALFAAADAVVLPYRSATATQNVWLAHEHGRPVIATRTGGLPDHVREGVDGLLCAPGDTIDLARAITEFAAGDTAQRLRRGVRPVDPEPYWRSYLDTLLA